MAHWYSIGIQDMSFTADVDLTAGQYRFVTVASTPGFVTCNTGASNPAPVGVLQNSPSAGQEAKVRVFGPTKLIANAGSTCAIRYGSYFTASDGGQATTANNESCGINLGRWYDATVALSTSAIGQAFIWAGLSVCQASSS